MVRIKNISSNIAQIYGLVVKDLKIKLRFKSEYIVEYVVPLLTLFFPYLIFTTLFDIDENIIGGYYSRGNFVLFLLLAYCIECFIYLLWDYKNIFYDEKIWQTIKGVVIAPISKFQLLFSIFISGLISKSFPIIIITIICLFLFPIPPINVLLVILLFFCIGLVLASMGFIIGLFELVNENISATLTIGISFISLISCLFYPISIFPSSIHWIIQLNPLYHFFDLLRLVWWAGINYEEALGYINIFHVLNVIGFTILAPIAATYLFHKIYYKYGTRGY